MNLGNIGNIGNNLGSIMKLKDAWQTFATNHPKFPMFLNAVRKKGIKEGTVMEIKFIDPDGSEMTTNIKVTASDMELFEVIRNLRDN